MSKKTVLLFDGSDKQLQVLSENATKYISQEDQIFIISVMVSEEIKAGMAGAWYYSLNFESSFEEQKQALTKSSTAEMFGQKYKATFEFLFNPLFGNVLKKIADIAPDLLIIPHYQESNPIRRWWNGSPSVNVLDRVASNILFLTYT